MRKLFFCFLVLQFFSFSVIAQDSTTVVSKSGDTSKLSSNIGGLSIGYVKVGTAEVANLTWHPDFKFGPWELGADLNYGLGNNVPSGYENAVLRYIGYNDGQKGLRYGIIDNLTWGHGLLIDKYSTRLTGSVLLNNQQMAWLGYYSFDPYMVRGLITRTGIDAVRVEEKINPVLTLGQTYITDSDGITIPGTAANQQVSGLGVDATVPLPFNFEGYGEYAQLLNRGGGLGAGISWAQDFMVAAANFSAGCRMLDSRFVPGYFNAEYETNPINLTSAEATGNTKNGYLVQLGVNALGLASLNARYENYNESDAAVTADLFAKLPQDVEVTGYYQQPKFASFRSLSLEEGAIMGGTMSYPVNPFTKAIVHYKKAYNASTGQVEESQYYEVKFSF